MYYRSRFSFCHLIGIAVFVYAVLLVVYPESRMYPAQLLYRAEQPVKGEDAIVLLMGDALDRAPHAAALYKKGFGKKIVFVEPEMNRLMEIGLRPLEGQMVYEYLTKFLKVPPEAIIFNSKTRVSSTREEARELVKILEKQQFRRVILVTSWYHSSRAAWIFARAKKEKALVVTNVPTPIPGEWYKDEKSFLDLFNEYLKWVHSTLSMSFGAF